MSFDPTYFPFLKDLPNPIRPDLTDIVFQECDQQHAPPSWFPQFKQLLKAGGSPLVQINGAGVITRSRITNAIANGWTPVVPPGSQNKLILSVCSMALVPSFPSNSWNDAMFDADSSATDFPIVNFIPAAGSTIATSQMLMVSEGISGSMWTAVYLWAVALAATPNRDQLKAAGRLVGQIDNVVRGSLAKFGITLPNRRLPNLQTRPDFAMLLPAMAADVAFAANTAGASAPLSGFDAYWASRPVDNVAMQQARDIWNAALLNQG